MHPGCCRAGIKGKNEMIGLNHNRHRVNSRRSHIEILSTPLAGQVVKVYVPIPHVRIGVKLIFILLIQICHINSIRTFVVAAMQHDNFFSKFIRDGYYFFYIVTDVHR